MLRRCKIKVQRRRVKRETPFFFTVILNITKNSRFGTIFNLPYNKKV